MSYIKKEQIGDATLYLGDCLEIMSGMHSKIDMILADYPFNCQDGRKDYNTFVYQTMKECYDLLTYDGNICVINNPINFFKTMEAYKNFYLRNAIALIRKGSFRPAWHFGFQYNLAYILMKTDIKKLKWNGTKINHNKNFLTDVVHYQNSYRSKYGFHPQAIPLDLAVTFVSILSPRESIVEMTDLEKKILNYIIAHQYKFRISDCAKELNIPIEKVENAIKNLEYKGLLKRK